MDLMNSEIDLNIAADCSCTGSPCDITKSSQLQYSNQFHYSSGPSTDTSRSTAAVGASIGTAVGASVSVTFVVLCYISRRSKELYKPSSHADPATVYDEVGTNKKLEGDVMEMDTNTAYGLVSARPLR